MNDTADAPYGLQQRLGIIVSCMLGFALDLYDVLIMPYLMPSIQHSMRITLGEAASITTITLIGSVLGGGVFGWLGDRIGRKAALQWTLVVFAVASVSSAFAWNFSALVVLRFIVGVGLGGEWGAGMVLFNETWNPQRRGLGTALIQGSAAIAGACASIVGLWAVQTFSADWGWRIGLLTGGSPVVLAVFIRFWMPESKVLGTIRSHAPRGSREIASEHFHRDVEWSPARHFRGCCALAHGLHVLLLRGGRLHPEPDAQDASDAVGYCADHDGHGGAGGRNQLHRDGLAE
ncbi:hypothetical protein YK56LOC_35900 [Caballeronia sp. HLA56]